MPKRSDAALFVVFVCFELGMLVTAVVGGVNAGAYWAGYGGRVTGTVIEAREEPNGEGGIAYVSRMEFEEGNRLRTTILSAKYELGQTVELRYTVIPITTIIDDDVARRYAALGGIGLLCVTLHPYMAWSEWRRRRRCR